MPIDTSSFIELTSDSRYDVLKRPVKVDKDNKAYEIQFLPPATGMGTYSKMDETNTSVDMSATCYNSDGSLHYIEVSCGSDYKANMQGTFIVLDYYCAQARKPSGAAYKGTPIAPVSGGAGSSMPWNTLTFFNTASLKLNQSQTPIEQYVNAGVIDHITTARILKKYKKYALEKNDMTFNTPCIESAFDTDAAISDESGTRATNWMGANGLYNATAAAGTTTLIPYQKVIPLSDLFESCENPGIWTNMNKFRFEFTLKLPDAIAFTCGTNGTQTGAGKVHVYVNKIGLMFDSTRMQAMQAVETATEKQAGSVENIAYLENFCLPLTYKINQQLVATGQRDVQELILGFPVKGVKVDGTNICRNPIQYFCGGLKSLSCMYGSDMPMRTPLNLSGYTDGSITTKQNASAYALYRKSCGADRASIVPLALNFTEYERYHFYFLPIYNPILPHRNNDPKDLRVDTTVRGDILVKEVNGVKVTETNAVMIVRKFAGAQIDSTGIVEKL